MTAALRWKYREGEWYCSHCREDPHHGVYDATGKKRDREWLNKKLEITRTDKKWHDDIKSRRTLKDGTVGRFKQGRGGNYKRVG